MPRYREIEGKSAIVTGAGRGIGRAMALRLAKEGASVAVTDVEESGAEAVAQEIRSQGGQAFGLKVDVTRSDDVENMISKTVENQGRLDILVANAGIGLVARLLDTSEEDWDRVMAVNAKGVFLCCKAAAEQMIEQGGGGRIIINALPPELSDIVMSVNSGEETYASYRRERDAEERLLDRFRDPNDPLKIIVVTSKLLTGFDAPIHL